MTVDEIIQSARSETEVFLLNSIEANNIRLRRFSRSYNSEQISSNKILENQARSLLNIQSQLENALGTVRSGNSMIYGIEVSGDQNSLPQLRSDDNIEMSISATLSNTISIDRKNLKPKAYRKEYRDISLIEANSIELHSMMLEKIHDMPKFLFMKPNNLDRL